MLLSFVWFIAGAICSLALLRVNARQLRLQRTLRDARRARLDGAGTIDAMPPRRAEYATEPHDDFDIQGEIDRLTGRVQSLYSQEMLERARRALHPGLAGLGIRIRTRE